MATIQTYGYAETATEAVSSSSFTFEMHGRGVATFEPRGNFTSKILVIAPTGVINQNSVRVYFDRKMKNNSDLIDKNNYSIIPDTTSGITVNVVSITAEDVDEPIYVDLIVSEFTDGELYSLVVDGPVDTDDIPMDPLQSAYSLIGQGELPTVESLIALSKSSFEITFNETMYENDFIKDTSNYSFDKGLQVLAVNYQNNKIILSTSDQTPGEIYTLTISSQP